MPEQESHLTAEQLDELRERLETQRNELVEDYERNRADMQEIDVTELGDAGDQGLREQSRSHLLKLEESEREELRLIEEALERMDEGAYGYDLETGEPIPVERLRAVPWAMYTKEGQDEAERGVRDEGRLARGPGGGSPSPR